MKTIAEMKNIARVIVIASLVALGMHFHSMI